MKKAVWDFGSHWEAHHAHRRLDESAETTCDSERDYLGFRLVHDGAGRVFRGDPWFGTGGDSRGAKHHSRLPAYRYGFLGFRLCVDWRGG